MRQFASSALGKLDLVAYLSTTLNTGHAWGTARETLILPVLPRDEEPQPTTQESMFNFVRLSDGGPARYPGPRSEVSVLAALGRGVLGDAGPVDWSELESHQRPRADRRRDSGARADGDIDRTRGRSSTFAGRRLDTPQFPTASGKAQFHAAATAGSAAAQRRPAAADDDPLRGAVQHGRLRGGRHLPRPGAARRHPDESATTSSAWGLHAISG